MNCCPTAGQLAGRLPDLTRALPPDPVRIANPYAPPIHPWDGSRAASRYAWPTWGGRTLTTYEPSINPSAFNSFTCSS